MAYLAGVEPARNSNFISVFIIVGFLWYFVLHLIPPCGTHWNAVGKRRKCHEKDNRQGRKAGAQGRTQGERCRNDTEARADVAGRLGGRWKDFHAFHRDERQAGGGKEAGRVRRPLPSEDGGREGCRRRQDRHAGGDGHGNGFRPLRVGKGQAGRGGEAVGAPLQGLEHVPGVDGAQSRFGGDGTDVRGAMGQLRPLDEAEQAARGRLGGRGRGHGGGVHEGDQGAVLPQDLQQLQAWRGATRGRISSRSRWRRIPAGS